MNIFPYQHFQPYDFSISECAWIINIIITESLKLKESLTGSYGIMNCSGIPLIIAHTFLEGKEKEGKFKLCARFSPSPPCKAPEKPPLPWQMTAQRPRGLVCPGGLWVAWLGQLIMTIKLHHPQDLVARPPLLPLDSWITWIIASIFSAKLKVEGINWKLFLREDVVLLGGARLDHSTPS